MKSNKKEFEVLTAVSTKMVVFWVVAPCSLVKVYQRFRGPCCLHHQGDDHQITRRYNPEDSHLQRKGVWKISIFQNTVGLRISSCFLIQWHANA
jgi:hypothetical protein